ncbi:hypothetical protein [uncultured Corynebacterium sp.]|uniref:hypothetical protein n=1 Tax=uncultured Corynebacterium sp. TaxID=159447 RepID=UPI0026170080|nr:hypothetical protein [uncultured Corynebacterium sp.]
MQRTLIFAILAAFCLAGCAQPRPERPLPTSVGATPLADAPSWQPPPRPLAPRDLPREDASVPSPPTKRPSPSTAALAPESGSHPGPTAAPQQRPAPAPAPAPRPQPAAPAPRPPARDKSGLPNLNIPPHEVRGRIEDAVPDVPAVPAMPAPAPPPAPPLPPAPRIPGL